MDARPQDSGTFFSVSYDLARQAEIQAEMAEKWGGDSAEDNSPADELTDAFKESYVAMLGRSRVDVSFTANGLVIDSSISFN